MSASSPTSGVNSLRAAGETLISVRGVSKKFCRDLRRSMLYGIADLTRGMLRIKPPTDRLRPDEFWALDDLNFEIRRGETVGLIGANGSGKTTLLRLIAGILPPDKGEIAVRGRIGSLIAVGAGFHPHMTGRENIHLNGAILGMTRKEIEAQFDSIVDFAEIGDFLEAPLATYSSGMRVRLGFAIAAALEPDILLLDEILAVGDAAFRAKCYNRIADLQERCAVVFVSHAMEAVGRVCDRSLLLQKGRIAHDGDVGEGIRALSKTFAGSKPQRTENEVKIVELELLDETGNPNRRFSYGRPLRLRGVLKFEIAADNPDINVVFLSSDENYVAQCNGATSGLRIGPVEKGAWRFELEIPSLQLAAGEYRFSISIRNQRQTKFFAWLHGVMPFEVVDSASSQVAHWPIARWSWGAQPPARKD